jgi:hypothetical protein
MRAIGVLHPAIVEFSVKHLDCQAFDHIKKLVLKFKFSGLR